MDTHTMMNRRPLLYVAGPFSFPDSMHNTHRACRFATAVFEHTTFIPYVPHLTLLWNIVTPRPYDHWLTLDRHALLHCNAIVRLPGVSPGADDELAVAEANSIYLVEFDTFPAVVCREWRAELPAR